MESRTPLSCIPKEKGFIALAGHISEVHIKLGGLVDSFRRNFISDYHYSTVEKKQEIKENIDFLNSYELELSELRHKLSDMTSDYTKVRPKTVLVVLEKGKGLSHYFFENNYGELLYHDL